LKYNTEIWDKYTEENTGAVQNRLSEFIFNSILTLGGGKILEAGCNIGNNLSSFPENYEIYGLDLNEKALEKCKARYQSFKFEKGSLLNIPFPDSFFDIVFTRGVLIHIAPENLDSVLSELLRVSKKWIFNLEYHGEDNKMIKWKRGDDMLWYRNMKERWIKYNVEIISEKDIPESIDEGKTRLTLVRKNNGDKIV